MQHLLYVGETLRCPHQNDDLLGCTTHALLGFVCLAGVWDLEADCMIALCHNESEQLAAQAC